MRWAGNEPPMQDPLSPARKFPLRDSEWLPYVLSTDRKLSRNPNPNRTEQFNSFSPGRQALTYDSARSSFGAAPTQRDSKLGRRTRSPAGRESVAPTFGGMLAAHIGS